MIPGCRSPAGGGISRRHRAGRACRRHGGSSGRGYPPPRWVRGLRAAWVVAAAVAPGLGAAPGAVAQSLFGAGGLGTPAEALDARARALGGVALGLFEPSLRPYDPAGALGFAFPSATASLQPGRAISTLYGATSEASATRFPLFAVAYPVSPTSVATVSYGAFLDLRWSLRRAGTEFFGGRDVAVEDRFVSDGGVAALRIGWAQQLRRGLGVGASVGLYTGQLARHFSRQIDTAAAGAPVDSFAARGEWKLTGPSAAVGVRWDALPALRVAASVTWSGALRALPAEGFAEQERGAFRLPLEVRAGVSGRLTPRLTASLGASLADWSETGHDLAGPAEAGKAWSAGVGIEWTGASLLGRTAPVRVGYRRAQLPFHIHGDAPAESAFTAGLGVNLLQAEEVPLARFDFAFERGARRAGRLEESFWRATFTLHVAGR